MFIVTIEGVYCHGVVGVSTTRKGATRLAKRAAINAPDDYHRFYVTRHATEVFPTDEFVVATVYRKGKRVLVAEGQWYRDPHDGRWFQYDEKD